MGTINIQSTDLSHKAGLTYTGTSDKTIDVDSLVTKVSSTDNAIVRFDGTSGAVQNSSVVIDDSGNVGIGLTNGSSKLTVGANPPESGAIAAVGSSGGIALALSDNINASLYIRPASNGAIIGTDGGGTLRFATNGNTASEERMRITSSGNLLVGTTIDNGVNKLQVNGSVNATEFNTEKLTIIHTANQWTALKDMTGLESGVYMIHQQSYDAATYGGFIMFSINESAIRQPLPILNTKGSTQNCGFRLNGRIVECIFPIGLPVNYSIIKI